MRRIRGKKHSAGETLVETIVSFAIVLLTLVTITATVQLCIRLNNKAVEKAEALEAAGTALENGDLPVSGQGTLILRLEGEGHDAILCPFDMHQGALLSYFEPRTGGGG